MKLFLYSSIENNDLRLQAYILDNIGSVYREQGKYTQALDYYQKSLQISQTLSRDQAIRGRTINNIGLVYSDRNYLGCSRGD